MENIIKNFPLIIILCLSFLTRFLFLGYPPEVVFDEVYFGKFVNRYFSHQYYFDIHPPLGKLIIFFFAKIIGYQGNLSFNAIGESSDSFYLFFLRFMPVIFGIFLPLVIYFILKEIGLSKKACFLGSFLAIFENSLLVQSKFILVDIFLLVFGFLSILFYLKYKKSKGKKSFIFLILTYLFATFAFSIKWTGLLFIGVIFLLHFFELLNNFNKKEIKNFLFKISLFLFIFIIIYYAIFLIHFSLLYKSGDGDNHMSLSFQKTLLENKVSKNVKPLSNWQKFIELNNKMYFYNASIKEGHINGSKWFQWPFGIEPIWYWTKTDNIGQQSANIYLFGNFLIYWIIIISIIYSFFCFLKKEKREKMPDFLWVCLIGWVSNLFPYLFIKRVAFLYHYFPSLLFGILIVSILYDRIYFKLKEKGYRKIENFIYFGFLFSVFSVFLILTPLTYGFFIPSKFMPFYNFLVNFFSF